VPRACPPKTSGTLSSDVESADVNGKNVTITGTTFTVSGISLAKNTGASGQMRVNLNWNQGKGGGKNPPPHAK